jgi:NADPH:quinone reductase
VSVQQMFGELFQLGHVVPDVRAAMEEWAATGIGPWQVIEDFPVEAWWYRGARTQIPIDVALAWSGPVQIELIAPRDHTPSMYREFLAERPSGGLQHFGFRCPDYAASLAAALRVGWTEWLSGRVDPTIEFCYLRPPAGSGLLPVEISRRS